MEASWSWGHLKILDWGWNQELPKKEKSSECGVEECEETYITVTSSSGVDEGD